MYKMSMKTEMIGVQAEHKACTVLMVVLEVAPLYLGMNNAHLIIYIQYRPELTTPLRSFAFNMRSFEMNAKRTLRSFVFNFAFVWSERKTNAEFILRSFEMNAKQMHFEE